jgi:co-chaperonin GroES (HSP10)|tara:strand:+ start:6301 stop:6723 length:423 start_codon:yes stop_codon:yes gene_type:complete
MSKKMENKMESAWVDPDEVVLDPTKLDATALERIPQPTGWKILVLPYRGKKRTKGGIVLTKDTIDRESLATVVAYVVKTGPLCYSDEKKYGKPWCKKGDWVLIGRYSGARFKLEDGGEVRIINDDEIIGTIKNPDDIISL